MLDFHSWCVTIYVVGKLIMVRIVGIVHRKPHGEQLDQADPVRNEETGLWQCPFCNKNDFPELSEVSTIYSCQHK